MIRKRKWWLLGGGIVVLLSGGVWSVLKARPKTGDACCLTHQGALPAGHPDISQMAPTNAPALTPEQIAAAKKEGCPYVHKKTGSGGEAGKI